MDTMGFHTYRMALDGDNLSIFIDNELVAKTTLQARVGSKQVFFGDFLASPGANLKAEIAYVGYSVESIFSPD